MYRSFGSFFLFALAGTLLLGNCGLVESNGTESTYFRATLNSGKTWRGTPEAAFSDVAGFDRWLNIQADTVYKKNFPYTESLSLTVPFQGPDDYSLTRKEHNAGEGWIRTSGSRFDEKNGDVLTATYYPTNDSSSNWVAITSYDSTTGIMEGTFRTTVVVDSAQRESEPGEPDRRRSDTLRFTDGEFRVKVKDRRGK